MALVVTGVGFLIHVYSTAYMAEDKAYSRYFAFLNLFTFFMLVLVMASDIVLMFVGWEGVGLCSYLLIGFWFDRPAAAKAGMKAFIVNRVGDAAFIIGILFLLANVGSSSLAAINAAPRRGPSRPGARHPRRPSPLRGRHREIGPGPALRLAPGRHGGPDARLAPSSTPRPWSRPASTWSAA